MNGGKKWATLTAAAGIIAGVFAIAAGLYAHSTQPDFGIPHFYGLYASWLSGVHVLIGLGVVMLVGGLLSFRWPGIGAVIVCLAAMAGLVYTYGRGEWRWTPYLYYWWGPWVFAWLTGIFGGYFTYRKVPQVDEALADARPYDPAG